jgi:quinol monooxygenase YgiN
MYAVVAVFTMDRARDEEQRRALKEEVIPITRQVPGFVSGYWMADPAGPGSHVLTIWDTEEQAHAFIRVVEARRPQGEQAGVGYESLTVVEVVAEAHR